MFRSFQPKSLCVLIFESLHFIASSWFWKNNLLYHRTVLSILFLKNRFRHFLHTYIFCFLSQILCFFFSHLYCFSIRTSVVLSIFTLLCRTRSLFWDAWDTCFDHVDCHTFSLREMISFPSLTFISSLTFIVDVAWKLA